MSKILQLIRRTTKEVAFAGSTVTARSLSLQGFREVKNHLEPLSQHFVTLFANQRGRPRTKIVRQEAPDGTVTDVTEMEPEAANTAMSEAVRALVAAFFTPEMQNFCAGLLIDSYPSLFESMTLETFESSVAPNIGVDQATELFVGVWEVNAAQFAPFFAKMKKRQEEMTQTP
jgi:hypothetical protein